MPDTAIITPGLDGSQITWPDGTIWPRGADDAVAAVHAPLADFGPSVASVDVDDAVIGCLQTWLPTYLQFVERSRSLGYELARPKDSAYATVIDPDSFNDFPVPGIFVVTSRTQNQPEISADGFYMTTWLTSVSAVVRGPNPRQTRLLASLYELAVRLTLIHQLKGTPIGRDFTPPVQANAVACQWIAGGEARPLEDPSGRGRWKAEGASQFAVFTDAAVGDSDGPASPDQPTYAPLAQVEYVDVEVNGVPINQTVEGGPE